MEGAVCSVCSKPVSVSDFYILHDKCDHYSHGECDDGLDDTCKKCKAEALVKEQRAAEVAANVPFPVEATAPVQKPTKKSVFSGVFATINEYSSPIRNRNSNPKASKDPWYLMQLGTPIHDFIYKGLDLETLKEQGVTLNKFLKYNYNLGRLRAFPEINNPLTGIDALIDWGLTADDLLQHQTALPMEELRAACGYTPRHLVERLGVGFDAKRGLVGADNKPGKYSLSDIMYLGLDSAEELRKAGLKKMSHWLELGADQQDMAVLNWTDRDTERLENDVMPMHDLYPVLPQDDVVGREASFTADRPRLVPIEQAQRPHLVPIDHSTATRRRYNVGYVVPETYADYEEDDDSGLLYRYQEPELQEVAIPLEDIDGYDRFYDEHPQEPVYPSDRYRVPTRRHAPVAPRKKKPTPVQLARMAAKISRAH